MTALDSSDAGTENGTMHHQIPQPQFGTNRTALIIFLYKKTISWSVKLVDKS